MAFGATVLVGLSACGSSSSGTANKGTIKIGVELPESGKEASNGLPTLNGVKYAVQKVGSIKGFTLAVNNKDDAVNGSHDATKGAQNIRDLAADSQVLGVIYLKDIVKEGMRHRFDQLRAMGIHTVMITGDNPLTAAKIADESGVDECLA